MTSHRFRAKLYTVGVNRCVDIPPEVTVALGGGTHIPRRRQGRGVNRTDPISRRAAEGRTASSCTAPSGASWVPTWATLSKSRSSVTMRSGR